MESVNDRLTAQQFRQLVSGQPEVDMSEGKRVSITWTNVNGVIRQVMDAENARELGEHLRDVSGRLLFPEIDDHEFSFRKDLNLEVDGESVIMVSDHRITYVSLTRNDLRRLIGELQQAIQESEDEERKNMKNAAAHYGNLVSKDELKPVSLGT